MSNTVATSGYIVEEGGIKSVTIKI